MKRINEYIIKKAKEFNNKKILIDTNDNDILLKKKKLEDYDLWINNLKQLMKNGQYRQILKDIEEKKDRFKLIKTELWKYRFIKSKAILKIIKIKMKKHSKEIVLENSSQNFALKFWFNQIFLTLEELNLEFRFDLNEHLKFNSKNLIGPIQKLIEYHLEFIYYLCIFAFKMNEVIPLLIYIAIADKFIPFISYITNMKPLNYLQNILLFKIKILIENCDYLSAFENIKLLFRLYFREMLLYFDFDGAIYYNSLDKVNKYKNTNIAIFCRVIQKLCMTLFLRGVACEHLGYFTRSIDAYKECRWFSNEFLFSYNKEIFSFFKHLEKKYLIYKEIFDDIDNQYKIRNNKNLSTKNKIRLSLKYYKNNKNKRYNSVNNINKSENRRIIRIKSTINSPTRRKKLENLLNHIGNDLYKEEENRNNNIFKKLTKNSFVLSTVKMIDNLLSDQFNHILKKMQKVEITKPKEEINHLINKTINFKRQKEFKVRLAKLKDSQQKKNLCKDNSCIQFDLYNRNKKQKMLLRKNNTSQINDKFNEKTSKNSVEKSFHNKNINNNPTDITNKSKSCIGFGKYSKYTENNKSVKCLSYKSKLLKYPLNKDVFSKSIISKKNYLDSFYEKELNFQKKLLKLKGYDMQKVINDYSQQEAINSAEQDFKIIKCFAESKNTKKNLINLVKSKEFNQFGSLFQNNKLRDRNTQNNIKILKNFMLLNNINPITKNKFDPDNVKNINEEKTKMLNMECARLELLQNKYEKQRKAKIK
jgi:hypothetical protein